MTYLSVHLQGKEKPYRDNAEAFRYSGAGASTALMDAHKLCDTILASRERGYQGQ